MGLGCLEAIWTPDVSNWWPMPCTNSLKPWEFLGEHLRDDVWHLFNPWANRNLIKTPFIFHPWVSKLRKDPKRKCRTQNLHGFVETPYLRNKPQATVPNAFWDCLWGWFLGPKQLLRRYLEHTRLHNQTSPSAHGLQSPHPRALGWLHILNTGPNITSFNCDKFVVFIMVWGSALGASRACV